MISNEYQDNSLKSSVTDGIYRYLMRDTSKSHAVFSLSDHTLNNVIPSYCAGVSISNEIDRISFNKNSEKYCWQLSTSNPQHINEASQEPAPEKCNRIFNLLRNKAYNILHADKISNLCKEVKKHQEPNSYEAALFMLAVYGSAASAANAFAEIITMFINPLCVHSRSNAIAFSVLCATLLTSTSLFIRNKYSALQTTKENLIAEIEILYDNHILSEVQNILSQNTSPNSGVGRA